MHHLTLSLHGQIQVLYQRWYFLLHTALFNNNLSHTALFFNNFLSHTALLHNNNYCLLPITLPSTAWIISLPSITYKKKKSPILLCSGILFQNIHQDLFSNFLITEHIQSFPSWQLYLLLNFIRKRKSPLHII